MAKIHVCYTASRSNAADLSPAVGTYSSAQNSNYLRSHFRRNHLLHHQRHYANNVIDEVRWLDCGQHDGDPESHCSGERIHQQRGRFRYLHHNLTIYTSSDGLNANVLCAG